jgi:hypothetical protein
MQIIMYTLITFALIGFVCTVLCVVCGTDLSELMPVYKPHKKKVGATFWGHYDDTTDKDEESFKLPKLPDEEMTYLVGSSKYAQGKVVRSLRK